MYQGAKMADEKNRLRGAEPRRRTGCRSSSPRHLTTSAACRSWPSKDSADGRHDPARRSKWPDCLATIPPSPGAPTSSARTESGSGREGPLDPCTLTRMSTPSGSDSARRVRPPRRSPPVSRPALSRPSHAGLGQRRAVRGGRAVAAVWWCFPGISARGAPPAPGSAPATEACSRPDGVHVRRPEPPGLSTTPSANSRTSSGRPCPEKVRSRADLCHPVAELSRFCTTSRCVPTTKLPKLPVYLDSRHGCGGEQDLFNHQELMDNELKALQRVRPSAKTSIPSKPRLVPKSRRRSTALRPVSHHGRQRMSTA